MLRRLFDAMLADSTVLLESGIRERPSAVWTPRLWPTEACWSEPRELEQLVVNWEPRDAPGELVYS